MSDTDANLMSCGADSKLCVLGAADGRIVSSQHGSDFAHARVVAISPGMRIC